jgi:hypothetical protein
MFGVQAREKKVWRLNSGIYVITVLHMDKCVDIWLFNGVSEVI